MNANEAAPRNVANPKPINNAAIPSTRHADSTTIPTMTVCNAHFNVDLGRSISVPADEKNGVQGSVVRFGAADVKNGLLRQVFSLNRGGICPADDFPKDTLK